MTGNGHPTFLSSVGRPGRGGTPPKLEGGARDTGRTVPFGPVEPSSRQSPPNQLSIMLIACPAISQSFPATFSDWPLHPNNLPTDPYDSRTVLLRLMER